MTRRALALLAAALALTLAPIAAGHYKESKRWTFSGASTKLNSRSKIDPLDIIYYRYGISPGTHDTEDRVHTHSNAHWRRWKRSEELPSLKGQCKGHQFVAFPPRSGRKLRENSHGVGNWKKADGPYDECRTRYHVRLWADNNHLGPIHSERKSWYIGTFHHETLNVLRFGAPQFHHINQDWDSVEHDVIASMNRRADAGHLDARGEGSRQGHCDNYRWRPLPGSRGWFGGKGHSYHSDGWMSLVSMLHCPRG